MKSIEISYEAFGELWKRARDGDRNEDDILRRLLGLSGIPGFAQPVQPTINMLMATGKGFYDRRFDVAFPQGFEIFRTYKDREYRATAVDGKWRLGNALNEYDSLNELNVAIGAKTENAWVSWYFDDNGVKKLIDTLRKPEMVRRRI